VASAAVKVPIVGTVAAHVHDSFEGVLPNANIPDW
jgi:hypothetical protein